jgi:hypothetical protein
MATVIQVKKEKRELKYGVMARLTLESILWEIWYGSQKLHLIGGPIHVKVDLVVLG